jgi:hypothetical protein
MTDDDAYAALTHLCELVDAVYHAWTDTPATVRAAYIDAVEWLDDLEVRRLAD